MSAVHVQPTPAFDSSVLSTIALGIYLRSSMPKQSIMEKDVSVEINTAKNVAGDMGQYHKKLYPKKTIAPIRSVISETKELYYAMTLPWLDRGMRLLPTAAYLIFINKYRELKQEWAEAVDEFVKHYGRMHATLPQLLGSLYNPSEYPAPNDIINHFALEVDFCPIPTSNDFRVTHIASTAVEELKKQYNHDEVTGIQTAMQDCWQRVAERVGHMITALKNYEPAHVDEHGAKIKARGKFHGTLVSNIRELVDLLPMLNLTNDPNLTAIADQMRQELCLFDADDLKTDADVRSTVAAQAEMILNHVSQFLA